VGKIFERGRGVNGAADEGGAAVAALHDEAE